VTLYGVVDIGYVYAKSGDLTASRISDGVATGLQGSRLGVRGEEALGNGLKAIFNLEWGFEADNGAGVGLRNTRQVFVGLSGGFGALTFGRQYAPTTSGGQSLGILGPVSANGYSSVNVSNVYNTAFVLMSSGNARWDNSISYTSPNMSGFQVQAIYSFGDQIEESVGDATRDASKFGIGFKYASGPLFVGASYHGQLKDKGTTTAGGVGKMDGWTIGAAYDFKVVKLYGSYIEEKDKRAAYGFKKKYFGLGVGVPVSQVGTVQVEAAQMKYDGNKSKGISLGYVHSLSKRTRIFTYFTVMDNDEPKAGTAFTAYNRSTIPVALAGSDEKQTAFTIGFNHRF
jgi:predicted porin